MNAIDQSNQLMTLKNIFVLPALLIALGACGPTPEKEPMDTTGMTPNEIARAKGVDFRGRGNEPGWHVEIDMERDILFVYDYGGSVVNTVTPGPRKKGNITRFDARQQGEDLVITIEDVRCNDTMSDEQFSKRVEIIYNGKTFTGCGDWL